MLTALLAVTITVLVTQAAVLATSIYLHRGLAHRALTLHPLADFFFRIILWITTGQDRRQWVAVHRKHHAFTDTEKDPHSPLVHGFWKIQLGNVYYYIREARNPETLARWAKDIREDWWDRRIFSKGTLGGILGLVLAMLVLGPAWGMFVVAVHLVLYVFVLAPVDQRPRPLVGPAELRQQLRDEYPGARLAHRRREPAQQPPRLSVEPEVQRAALGVRSLVGSDQGPRGRAAHHPRGRQGQADLLARPRRFDAREAPAMPGLFHLSPISRRPGRIRSGPSVTGTGRRLSPGVGSKCRMIQSTRKPGTRMPPTVTSLDDQGEGAVPVGGAEADTGPERRAEARHQHIARPVAERDGHTAAHRLPPQEQIEILLRHRQPADVQAARDPGSRACPLPMRRCGLKRRPSMSSRTSRTRSGRAARAD